MTLLLIAVLMIASVAIYHLATSGRKPVVSEKREERRLPIPTDTVEVVAVASGRRSRSYKCGHKGPRWFVVSAYGEETKKIRDRQHNHRELQVGLQ